jgi:hypothetical protein
LPICCRIRAFGSSSSSSMQQQHAAAGRLSRLLLLESVSVITRWRLVETCWYGQVHILLWTTGLCLSNASGVQTKVAVAKAGFKKWWPNQNHVPRMSCLWQDAVPKTRCHWVDRPMGNLLIRMRKVCQSKSTSSLQYSTGQSSTYEGIVMSSSLIGDVDCVTSMMWGTKYKL